MSRRGSGKAVAWLRAHVDYDDEGCLIWPFYRDRYGHFGHEGEHHYAHRFMCELVNGPPPTPEHQAAHSCGHGEDGCVHPKHLSWKTLGGNMLDKTVHGTNWKRVRARKLTHEQADAIRASTEKPPALAKQFGVSESTIRHIRAGRIRTRAQWGGSRLTEEQIASIRNRTGWGVRPALAAEFGVSTGVIERIQKGQAYRNPTVD